MPGDLRSALQEAFARLQADQATSPDWHPHTNETVQDLVHPSMYPLVYGRSRFLPEEVVGVEDAIDKWAGKGEVIPKKLWKADLAEEPRFPIYSGNIGKSYWSTTYQWLPANVKFVDDGGVKFTSYINGLHPSKYRDIYITIEKLIEKALPMWDQCLAQYVGIRHVGPGTHEPRIEPDDPEYVFLFRERWSRYFTLAKLTFNLVLVTRTRTTVCTNPASSTTHSCLRATWLPGSDTALISPLSPK